MKHAIFVLAVVASTSSARADRFNLDYRATDPSCVDAKRFADEVSAKLGFVPWQADATSTLRIRVERDGTQFTGTFRNKDGSAKVVDGATCEDVTRTLVVTVATAVDTTPLGAPLKTEGTAKPAAAHANDDRVPVTFASTDGWRVDITLNSAGAVGTASNGTSIVANYFEGVCTSPCTARLQRGRSYLQFQDPEHNTISGGRFVLDRPTTISLSHESRRNLRVIGFIVGVGLTGLGAFGLSQGGTTGIVGGSVALALGIPGLFSPFLIHDTFAVSQSP